MTVFSRLAHGADPKKWSPTDWAGGAVPHLVYGAAVYATLIATDDE